MIKLKELLKETKFYAFWKNKKHTINGKSLYDAKQQAITKLKIPKSKVGLLAVVNASEHDKGSFKFEGKLNEGREPLWNKDNVDKVIKQIQKGIKVPYADGLGLGALSRRDEHPSILGKISLDPKREWPNGYIENSRWALVRIDADGTIDTVRMNGYSDFKTRKKVPVLRKSRNRSIRQIIDRLGKYFTVVRLKHPDTKAERVYEGKLKTLLEGKDEVFKYKDELELFIKSLRPNIRGWKFGVDYMSGAWEWTNSKIKCSVFATWGWEGKEEIPLETTDGDSFKAIKLKLNPKKIEKDDMDNSIGYKDQKSLKRDAKKYIDKMKKELPKIEKEILTLSHGEY